MNDEIEQVKTQIALEDDFAEDDSAEMVDGYEETNNVALVPAGKNRVTTISLTADTCRWPFGDPAKPDFHYCGDLPLAGRPYCDKHDAQSYHAARPKKAAA